MDANSPIMVPVILMDALGRKVEAQAPSDATFVMASSLPFGAFRFDVSEEIDPSSLKRIFKQAMPPMPTTTAASEASGPHSPHDSGA